MSHEMTRTSVKFHGAVIYGKLKLKLARFELESDRLVVYEHSRLLMGLGLIGAILSRVLRGKRTIDLPYTMIATLGRGKFGFNKKVLDVTTVEGQTYRFNMDDASASLVRARVAERAQLVETGAEKWQVLAA
jgi:hypothetical protein